MIFIVLPIWTAALEGADRSYHVWFSAIPVHTCATKLKNFRSSNRNAPHLDEAELPVLC